MVEMDRTKGMSPSEVHEIIQEAMSSPTIKCFDFKKAISIIKRENIKNARWGLDGDWADTSDYCLRDGKAVTVHDAYLNSTWATPTLIDNDTGLEYPCFTVENKSTYETRIGWNEEEIDLINNTDYQSTLIR